MRKYKTTITVKNKQIYIKNKILNMLKVPNVPNLYVTQFILKNEWYLTFGDFPENYRNEIQLNQVRRDIIIDKAVTPLLFLPDDTVIEIKVADFKNKTLKLTPII